MLAVSASVSFGELLISCDAADDAASLVITGDAYAVTGNNGSSVAGSPFSGVTSGVRVIGTVAPNQSFTFGGTTPLGVRLSVDAAIEAATINETINAAGPSPSADYVRIGAPSITLGADITTTGTQSFAGDVVLTKSVSLKSTGGQDVTFGKAINSAAGLANSLSVTTAGTTTLGGTVGGSLGGASALGGLAISTGDTIIKSALINTSGATGQTYGGNVLLAADVWLNSGDAATATWAVC